MTFSRIVAGYFYLVLDSNKRNVIYPSFLCSDLETIDVSCLPTVSTYLSVRLEGKHGAQGQRREVSYFATPPFGSYEYIIQFGGFFTYLCGYFLVVWKSQLLPL